MKEFKRLNFSLYAIIFCLAAAEVLAAERILPVGPDSRLACVVTGDGNTLAGKASLGKNSSPTYSKVIKGLRTAAGRLRKKLSSLRASGKRASRLKLRKVRSRIRDTRRTKQGITACRRNRLSQLEKNKLTFEFFCLHGFHVPSVSLSDRSCGLNLSGLQHLKTKVSAGIITVIDSFFVGACALEGGSLYRVAPKAETPLLYYGICNQAGETVTPMGNDFISALGMESEFSDEDDIPEPAPDNDSGNDHDDGDSTVSPNPAADCFILQMEAEFTDCE